MCCYLNVHFQGQMFNCEQVSDWKREVIALLKNKNVSRHNKGRKKEGRTVILLILVIIMKIVQFSL